MSSNGETARELAKQMLSIGAGFDPGLLMGGLVLAASTFVHLYFEPEGQNQAIQEFMRRLKMAHASLPPETGADARAISARHAGGREPPKAA